MVWISFGTLPCRKKTNLTARVSMLLKSRASLTCFRACFLPGRAKDLSAPRYFVCTLISIIFSSNVYLERVCSQTQLCRLRCFNDCTRQLHVSAPTGHLAGCLQENLRSYSIMCTRVMERSLHLGCVIVNYYVQCGGVLCMMGSGG